MVSSHVREYRECMAFGMQGKPPLATTAQVARMDAGGKTQAKGNFRRPPGLPKAGNMQQKPKIVSKIPHSIM